MTPLDIARLAVGDRVQHELLVRERDDKTTKGGDPFVVLKLGNGSGTLSVNVWKEHVPLIEGVRAGQVVQVIGIVESYKGARQLKLTAPPRVVAAAAADPEAFLPRVRESAEALWARVDAWRAEMRGPLRRAVDTFFADDAFRTEFARCPGATRGHHALLGGLLLHSVEVAEIARASVGAMKGDVPLVTAGALLHDIGKVRAYSVGLAGFDNTDEGHLLGHVVLGSLMLEERLARLAPPLLPEQRLELHHFIQSHHGVLEYGAAVRPMTLEAELLHFADQASAKGNNFTEEVEAAELFPTAETRFSAKRSFWLERRLWRRAHRWD